MMCCFTLKHSAATTATASPNLKVALWQCVSKRLHCVFGSFTLVKSSHDDTSRLSPVEPCWTRVRSARSAMSHVRSAVRYVPASSFRAVDPLDWIVTAEPQKRRRQEKTAWLGRWISEPLGRLEPLALRDVLSTNTQVWKSVRRDLLRCKNILFLLATDGFRSLIT